METGKGWKRNGKTAVAKHHQPTNHKNCHSMVTSSAKADRKTDRQKKKKKSEQEDAKELSLND